ncbi:MAG TPA: Holliday junction resolvase RuvX [Polyangiaceae bacterium]|nr:Holliday junction resolvase RuvX [Polyangiaceae bacterium]
MADGGVGAIAIGLPVNMDGSEGPRVQATRAFVRNMQRLTDLPFAFWDERLSTVAAERALLEMDVSRAKRQTRIDSAAAAFILQGVLDRLHALGADSGSDDVPE